jgi:hypothetical protein
MADHLRWAAKLGRDGQPLKDCWVTEEGYTVAICRLPETRFVVTRPGGVLPFAYLGDREEVVRIIQADIQASAGAGACA